MGLTLQHCRRSFAIATAALVLLCVTSGIAQTLPPRIPAAIRSSGLTALRGSVDARVAKARDLGRLAANRSIPAVTINLAPSAEQLSALRQLVDQQSNPSSPLYHQWLTQQEFGARFGYSDDDLERLVSWFTAQGLTLRNIAASRNAVTFSGTAAQMEAAFHTELHQVQIDGTAQIANTTAIALPQELAAAVTSVRGLSGFRPRSHMSRMPLPLQPAYTTRSGNHYMSPGDWATIYNVKGIYNAGYTGSGTHVGIIGQTYAPKADIDNFRSASGLSTTKLNYACISSSDCTTAAGTSTGGDLMESDLDIEWAGAIAKDATVDFIYAAYNDSSQGVFEALQYAIQNYTTGGAVVPILSMSYGSCEYYATAADASYIENLILQANAQGQTVLVSSGDSGAAGCDPHSSATVTSSTYGLYADFPGDVPNITAVGGTQFSGDVGNSSPYWNTSTTSVSTALQYIPETSWNETGADGLIASGGGVSVLFPQPSWQPAPSAFSGTPGRFVPDVALAASWSHDGYLVCSQTASSYGVGAPCSNGFLTNQGYLFMAGGTSAGAPSLAGVLAILTAKYGNFGNINPVLYQLAAGSSATKVFHDITSGSNIVPCVSTAHECDNGSIGYYASTGYDLVTGLGSLDMGGLYTALAAYSSTTATSIALTASSTAVSMGDTLALSATISASPSATISGSLNFYNGTINLGSATLSGNTATLNVPVTPANGFAGGNAALVSVSFAGDSTYSPSSSDLTVNVAALAQTTTTITLSSNSVTMGDTLDITGTVSVTGGGTVSGTIQFTMGSIQLGSATLNNGTATLSGVSISPYSGFKSGTTKIAASYSGDPLHYQASMGVADLTVIGYPTEVSAAGPSGGQLGTPFYIETITTTSAATALKPAGTVSILKNGQTIGSATLIQGGASVLVTLTLLQGFTAGSNTYDISYSGDTTFKPSTGTGTITLSKQSTSLALGSSSQPMGGTVTLTAYITPTDATGPVTFSLGNTELGTVNLTNGVAILAGVTADPNLFAIGKNTISLSYPGDTNSLPYLGTGNIDVYQPTTLNFSVTPSSASIGDTVTLSATVTPAAASGSVTFNWTGGQKSVNLANGTATTNVAVTTANGFYSQTNGITANYGGQSTDGFLVYGASSGAASLAITTSPTYTLTPQVTSVTLSPGNSSQVNLNLVPTVYSGTVSFAVTTSSAAITANAPSVSLASGTASSTATLTISASTSARNSRRPLPWQTGGTAVAICAVLLTWPGVRRRRVPAAFMLVLATLLAGFLISCGGGSGSNSPTRPARSYTVTVTPTGTGTVTNAAPITINVTVQ